MLVNLIEVPWIIWKDPYDGTFNAKVLNLLATMGRVFLIQFKGKGVFYRVSLPRSGLEERDVGVSDDALNTKYGCNE